MYGSVSRVSDVDPAIARIEAELSESRFQPWDVETFLANRHQAKIETLTGEPDKPWPRRWAAAKEIAWNLAAIVGTLTTVTGVGVWLLTGCLYVPPFVSGCQLLGVGG